MKKITVSRHQKLIDGEVYSHSEEKYEVDDNKTICVSLSKKFIKNYTERVVIAYIQIGSFLDKDFIEIELFDGDYFYVN